MKRIILISILMMVLLSVPVLGQATRWNVFGIPKADWWSGANNTALNVPLMWMRAVDPMIAAAGSNPGTGSIFYVDSGLTTAGDGTNWANALATLDEAVVLCEDNRGDIIYIAQGHAETWTAINSADLDIIGISVIGVGTGTDRPTFTYTTGTGGELVIAALNVRICNLVFQPGIADVAHAIEIEDDGDGSIIEHCEFLSGTTDAFEFVDAIQAASGADDIIIRFNKATETTAGAVSWLDISAGVIDNLVMYGNVIYGDYSTGAVDATSIAHTLGYYGFNTITNLSASDAGFFFNTTATGVMEFNRVFTDAEATAIDPGSMMCFENYVATAADVSGMITPVYDDGTTQLNATTVTAIASAVDALDGIGMIGLCETNLTNTTVISAALGGFGDSAFIEGWSLMCVYDTAGTVGTAPSGEIRDVTAYTSSGGVFTTAAWGAALTAGDYVILVPNIMIPDHYGKLGSKTIYCDDGGSDGEGTNWQNAKITLAGAEAIAAAGDTILVGENHNENLGATDTLDVVGLTVIGMGDQGTAPVFDYDTVDVELTLNAAGIHLKNLNFRPGETLVVAGVVLGSSGIGCKLEDCSFISGEGSNEEFIDCIVLDAASSTTTIDGCVYSNSNETAGDPDTFINLDAGTIAGTLIQNCKVFGQFDEACVWASTQVCTNVTVRDNQFSNNRTGQLAIEFQGAATGTCARNVLYSDTYGSVLDPGSLKCYENYATNAIDSPGYLIPEAVDEIAEIGTGRIFYVDASASNGDGRTWATAKTTLDAGVDLCLDDRGDTIYVAQGHTETVVADFVNVDQGGITIIGIGNGKLRPYFDYTTGVGSSMVIDNDDITIRNLWFHANIDSIAAAIEVKTTQLNVEIDNCLFTCESAVDEFDVCIDHAAGNHGAVVKNCQFQMGEAEAVSAVHFIDSDYAIITGNKVFGDYSTACIHNETTAADHITIASNILFNGTIAGGGGLNDQPCIELFASTTGVIVNNELFTNVTTPNIAIVALDCFLAGNTYSESESTGGSVGVATNRLRTDLTDILGMVGAGSVGDIYYVDSGESTTTEDGLTWATATDTLDEAVDLCGTGDTGDIILVAAGHTETLGTGSDGVDFDYPDITVIGLGVGENRPLFNYDTDTDEVVIGADDISIYNCQFLATANTTNVAIDIETGAENFIISGCRFYVGTLDTTEFDNVIVMANNCDGGLIENCDFEMGAAATVAAISGAGTDYLRISGNRINGNYSTACILDATTASRWITIEDNILMNGNGGTLGLNTEPVIELGTSTTAMIINNKCFCNETSPRESIVAADGLLSGNTYSENEDGGGSVGIAYTGIDMLTADAVSLLGGSSGNVFYCDSAEPSGQETGHSWATATDTLDEAINLCSNGVGNIILVAAGHAEDIGAVALDIDGVTVIGLGNGTQRPQFTFDGTGDIFTIDAIGVTLHNLSFIAGISDVVTAIELADESDYATISNCDFPEPANATHEFLVVFQFVTGADNVTITGNTVTNIGATAAMTHVIDGGAGAIDGLTVTDNDFTVEALTAIINSNQSDTNVRISGNVFDQRDADKFCVQFHTGAATGTFTDNLMCQLGGIAYLLDPGSLQLDGNKASIAIDSPSFPWPVEPAEGRNVGTGMVFYVDASATNSGDGETWDTAFITLDDAFDSGICLADRGDTVYVAAGHAEDLDAADDCDVDVSDVKIIGLGTGENRPTFSYITNTAGELVIGTGADDVYIENLHFVAKFPDVILAIDVEAGSENFVIKNCTFTSDTPGTNEWADIIMVRGGSDNGTIEGCQFYAAAGNSQSAINAVDADYLRIVDNEAFGDYTVACIENTTAAAHIIIEDNILFNGTTGGFTGLNAKPAITLGATTTGVIRNNMIACNLTTPGLSIVAANCFLSANTYTEDEGSGGSSVIGAISNSTTRSAQSTILDLSSAGNFTVFTITGGPIHVTDIVGIVQNTIKTAASNMKLVITAAVPGAGNDLTTAADIQAHAAGTSYTLGATVGAGWIATTNGQIIDSTLPGFLMPAGTIVMNTTVNLDADDSITWYMRYEPYSGDVIVTPQ